MHFHGAPSVAAEVPGFSHFSQEQLDTLARSVELRRQQLEHDINAYIQRKRDELRQYEIELVEQHRSMERDADPEAAGCESAASSGRIEDVAAQPAPTPSPAPPALPASPPSPAHAPPPPEEQKKQKKHGRVHKREKELYGLVTPVFLPLLDARESTSPTKKEKKEKKALKAATSADASNTPTAEQPSDAEHTKDGCKSQSESTDAGSAMGGDTPTKERSASDPGKKTRRSSIKKKSALRHSSTPRNRKRVSLVIDDQVVLPSDMIQEPALTSPTSDTTSATNSTASLDDLIDPRLTADAPVYIEHHDAVHHSLPLTPPAPKTPPPTDSEPVNPVSSSLLTSVPAYTPPSYATRSFLDPPPERQHIEDVPSTSPLASPTSPTPAPDSENFSTYVGGISGSGVDDVNQVGSVGYPSSLGASYLESYMSSRPLSVRMAAAQGGADPEELGRLQGLEERRRVREREERAETGAARGGEVGDWADAGGAKKKKIIQRDRDDDEDADADFMGSMDGF